MNSYYWNLILPMLQFLTLQTGYTVYWIAIYAMIQNGQNKLTIVLKNKLLRCIIGGLISTAMYISDLGPWITIMTHGISALVLFLICVIESVIGKNKRPQRSVAILPKSSLFSVIDITSEEKTILNKIQELEQSGILKEATLQDIYYENQSYIDSNPVIKDKIFTEVINWRRNNNVKCRVVDDDNQRRFINVNHRSVDWLR